MAEKQRMATEEVVRWLLADDGFAPHLMASSAPGLAHQSGVPRPRRPCQRASPRLDDGLWEG